MTSLVKMDTTLEIVMTPIKDMPHLQQRLIRCPLMTLTSQTLIQTAQWTRLDLTQTMVLSTKGFLDKFTDLSVTEMMTKNFISFVNAYL